MRYLLPSSAKTLAEFMASPLWAEIRLCMDERKPEAPDTKDPSHVAAAKGHRRTGFEEAFIKLKNLPLEFAQEQQSPFARPAVAITED